MSTTVNVSVVPDSFTAVDPDDSVTVKPPLFGSSSAVAAVTVWLAIGSQLSSELPSTTARVIVES